MHEHGLVLPTYTVFNSLASNVYHALLTLMVLLQIESEGQERLKLQEILKGVGGSIPDDAKISNLTSAVAAAAKSSPMQGVSPPPPPPPPPGGPAPPPPPPPPGGAPPPPPPPGGAPGGPPPPPPPGGKSDGGLFGFAKQPNRKAPKPSQPLKSFNWAKLPDVSIAKEPHETKLFVVEIYTCLFKNTFF